MVVGRVGREGFWAALGCYVTTEIHFPDYRCQLNRSTQHFVEVYWREFEILRFSWTLI
jgi:hypothetical protein